MMLERVGRAVGSGLPVFIADVLRPVIEAGEKLSRPDVISKSGGRILIENMEGNTEEQNLPGRQASLGRAV